jgi:hypothetical protein
MVSATDAGRQRHAAIARRRRHSMARMLGEFDVDERRQLADLLDRLRAALDHLAADLPDRCRLAARPVGSPAWPTGRS